MTTDEIMKLADAYAELGFTEGLKRKKTVQGLNEARAALHKAVEALAADAARYRAGREAEYAGLMPQFGAGKTWAEAMDAAYDAVMKGKTP